MVIVNFTIHHSAVLASVMSCPSGSYTIDITWGIADGEFWGCASLTSVSIGDSVPSIGNYAFYGCSSLISATIGNRVTSIGSYAFCSCTSLSSVNVPDSVTSLGDGAFSTCTSLASVTIGNSITSIGGDAFTGCTSLSSVDIPDSVTSIGDYAFYRCDSLSSVTIPAAVTSIGTRALGRCSELVSITVAPGNSHFKSVDGVLFSLDGATLIQFPAGLGDSYAVPVYVTSIGNYAFEYSHSLVNVTIPGSVRSIGKYAFYNCTSLVYVAYSGEKPPSFGTNVFADSSGVSVLHVIPEYAGSSCCGKTIIRDCVVPSRLFTNVRPFHPSRRVFTISGLVLAFRPAC